MTREARCNGGCSCVAGEVGGERDVSFRILEDPDLCMVGSTS